MSQTEKGLFLARCIDTLYALCLLLMVNIDLYINFHHYLSLAYADIKKPFSFDNQTRLCTGN